MCAVNERAGEKCECARKANVVKTTGGTEAKHTMLLTLLLASCLGAKRSEKKKINKYVS